MSWDKGDCAGMSEISARLWAWRVLGRGPGGFIEPWRLLADLGFGKAAGSWPGQGCYRGLAGFGATLRWQKGAVDAHPDLCRFSRCWDPMGCRHRHPTAPNHPDLAHVSHPRQLGARLRGRWVPTSRGITRRPPISPAIPRTWPHSSGLTCPASPFFTPKQPASAQGFS